MKTIQKFIGFLILLLLLVACSRNTNETNEANGASSTTNGNNSSAADDGDTIVTFAVNEFERGLYESRIEAFEQANPGIRIELVNIGEITGNSFIEAGEYSEENILDLVKSADVIAMQPTRAMIEQGLILDLAPLMAGDSQIDPQDFYPGVLEQYQQDGGTWALPLTAVYGILVYDKTQFDAAGVAYPEPGWTWADFVAKAQALTSGTGEEVQWGFAGGSGFSATLQFIEARAGRPFIVTSTDPATVDLLHPDVVDAFQWYADLAHVYDVMPTTESRGSDVVISSGGGGTSFSTGGGSGNVAMWLTTTNFINGDSLERENWGVVPFPVSTTNSQTSPLTSSSFGAGDTFVISAGTAKTDAAWAWLKFLSQQSAESNFFNSAALPARQSAAETSEFWNDLPESLAATLRYALEHTFTPSQTTGLSLDFNPLNEMILEQKAVQSVLSEVQTSVTAWLEQEAEEIAEATPVPPFAVAEPPSEQIPEGTAVIRFVAMGAPPDTYRELAKQFQEAYPDIVVQVQEPNFVSGDSSLATLLGEADCFQSFSSLDNPEDLQAVLSLQPFIESDLELSEADFYATVLDAFRKQGQLMGLPGEVTVNVLAYDKRIFEAAGRPYPQPGWTMEEFLETAVALTQGSGADKIYGFKPSFFEQGTMLLMMAQLGARFIDDSANPPQTNFTHPDTISALRWYANLTTEYSVKPSPRDRLAPPEPFAAASNAAIWAESSFGGGVLISVGGPEEEQDTSHIGYVPYPAGGNSPGFGNATGYFIAANTQQRQACWEWIKFLSSQPGLARNGIPAHIGAAASDAYAQLVGAEKAEVLRNILANSGHSTQLNRFASGASWISITSVWLEQAHTDVVNNGVSVEAALQQAQANADAYRSCVIAGGALADREKQFTCASEVTPALFGR
ncbi:MAG: extracellular solute-binding protein [Anaerolineaceae bacterium]|nr:extracellular solute-binding protein [Anaerolineaceae bacterium]